MIEPEIPPSSFLINEDVQDRIVSLERSYVNQTGNPLLGSVQLFIEEQGDVSISYHGDPKDLLTSEVLLQISAAFSSWAAHVADGGGLVEEVEDED